ncbi:MAG: YaaL family protein [Clostridia bacterium]|jgi:hypothetical protein|nr:YaaL family protein [Clostridia bacterium]
MERTLWGLRRSVEKIIKNSLDYLHEEMWVKGFGQEEQKRLDENQFSLCELVELARRDWEHARKIFEESRDPDMVDHAIFAMEAAERKYMYLLKKAREEKIVDSSFDGLRQIGGSENASMQRTGVKS